MNTKHFFSSYVLVVNPYGGRFEIVMFSQHCEWRHHVVCPVYVPDSYQIRGRGAQPRTKWVGEDVCGGSTDENIYYAVKNNS